MGEAKRRKLFMEARLKSLSVQTEAEMVDDTSIPGLRIIRHPEEIVNFREELAQPYNADLYQLGIKGRNFKECIAEIAAGLKIKVVGDYHPLILLNMLTEAMKARGRSGGVLSPLMQHAELKEYKKEDLEQDLFTLFDFGESYGTINNPRQTGKGPYTICDDCTTSFDCISVRACHRGNPAIQLEQTMKVIDVVVKGKGRMH